MTNNPIHKIINKQSNLFKLKRWKLHIHKKCTKLKSTESVAQFKMKIVELTLMRKLCLGPAMNIVKEREEKGTSTKISIVKMFLVSTISKAVMNIRHTRNF